MSKFMDNASRKVMQAQKFLTKNGQRNFQGFCETRNRILTTAKNYESMGMFNENHYEPIQSVFRGFSEAHRDFATSPAAEGAGLNGVANTYGIDVVDISILTSVKSFLPYLAVDRGMSKPIDLLTYQKLVAVNDAGGVQQGEEVVNPFSPINRKLALSRTDAKVDETFTGSDLYVGFPIAKGRTRAVYGTVLGGDYQGDGHLYWQGAGVDMDIDYAKGMIKLANGASVPSGATIQLEIYPDRTSASDGAGTLRLRAATDNIQLEAEPNRIILESSMEQLAYMNRLLGNSVGTAKEFGQIALQQLLNAFVYWINTDLVNTTWKTANKAVATLGTDDIFDMSSYYGSTTPGFDKFASTKNDLLHKFMLNMQGKLLNKSNQGVTYYLCGMQGANILANNTDKFVKSDIFSQQLNGVIGTYDGIPVLRHDFITGIDAQQTGIANIVEGHKDVSGAAAPVIYGEYLPLYSSRPGVNFANPTELSQAMFNMSKSDSLILNYIHRFQIAF